MRNYHRLLLISGVAAALSMPAPASAQAIPRTSGGPGTSSTSSSSGSSTRETPPPPAPQSQPVRSSPPPRSSPPSSGSSSSGSSTSSGSGSSSRPGAAGGSSAVRRGGGSTSGTSVGSSTPVYVGAGSRNRNGRPISYTAIRRTSPIGGGSFFDEKWLRTAGYPFSPWGRWYPWYTGGWGYGWVTYDPWRFGGTRWIWGRYGTWWYGATPWYDPWYDPYYDWFGMGYGGAGYSSSDDDVFTGTLRLKVNPAQAKVYIDDVLQGVVDDFNGLHSSLDVTEGTHHLEIRSDGYVTLKDEIKIEAGKTQTYRGSLKKSKSDR